MRTVPVPADPAAAPPPRTDPPLTDAAPFRPLLVHAGTGVDGFYTAWFLGAVFPLAAGLALYGWRALAVIGLMVTSAWLALLVWRRVGARGPMLRPSQGLWLALLLALMFPATFSRTDPSDVPWALPAAAGVVLAIFLWLLGGLGAARVHPALVTFLFLVALFYATLVPYWVLQRHQAFAGDLWDAPPVGARAPAAEPWVLRPPQPGPDAVWAEPASQRLVLYTTGKAAPDRDVLLLQGLIRDRLPPLEDLVVGGHPGPIGSSSAIAVIIGGLFLLYRGVIDYRIPLVIVLSAYLALLILPVPVSITDRGPHYLWLAMRDPRVQWVTAVTFAHYELMASPILFMAFFLATAPAVRPMARGARVLFAIGVGLLSAVAQLYLSVAYGPYGALLAVSLLTPVLDRFNQPKPLV